MAKITNEDSLARKERIYQLIRQSEEGIKESEIADILNIERRSVNNYLHELKNELKINKDGVYWYADAPNPIIIRSIELKAEEAMVLYLAMRLFVKQTDKRIFDAENVLVHIAKILKTDANLGDDILNAANQLAQRPEQEGYEDIFRTIMRAYLYRQEVEIVYSPYRGNDFATVIKPYLLEPSAIGFSTYVIGHSSIVNALRTYKIERILRAEMVRSDGYSIPADFPGLSLLQNAWSIFYGDEIVQVVLRFHPDVARRVRETYWHPSQSPVIDDPEKAGYVCLQFEVADTTDLKPWIRTWGANCEVLQPEALRDEMIGEARRYAELYGWTTHRGQGKSDDDDPLGLNTTFGDYFG